MISGVSPTPTCGHPPRAQAREDLRNEASGWSRRDHSERSPGLLVVMYRPRPLRSIGTGWQRKNRAQRAPPSWETVALSIAASSGSQGYCQFTTAPPDAIVFAD